MVTALMYDSVLHAVGLNKAFRVTYCATRLQTVEPVAGRPEEWVSVARRTVELEMGHSNSEMVDGQVVDGPQHRLRAVEYSLPAPRALQNTLHDEIVSVTPAVLMAVHQSAGSRHDSHRSPPQGSGCLRPGRHDQP
jgi:hypothetical protein